MLALHFEGWFQCRLATDPDPSDEPRGASGFTFALAGEPDFDRVIRFHDPIAPRSHGPRVGVFVRQALEDGKVCKEHPLLGARVDLLGEPKFESRNYVLRDSSQGPIVPFHLRIREEGPQAARRAITIERSDILHPADPGLPLHRIPTESLMRRGSWIPLTLDPVGVANTTGIADPIRYREERRILLEKDLEGCADPIAKAALEKRLSELEITDRTRMQVLTLTFYNDIRFEINGPARVLDRDGRLNPRPDPTKDWPIAIWMGAWDCDSLCGYASGVVSILSEADSHDTLGIIRLRP